MIPRRPSRWRIRSPLWPQTQLDGQPPAVRALVCLGTRPEAIKLAPVVLAAREEPRVELRVVALGQHGRTCDDVLRFFEIPVDVRFHVLRRRQTLGRLSSRCLCLLEDFFVSESPELIVVQGDTTSALMAGLAGFYARVPVWHVEAGLRTSTTATPFPEEMNRRLISRLASFHFAPTELARANLRREGIDDSQILLTGNTGIDALHEAVRRRQVFANLALARFVAPAGRLLVVTMHRRENWGEPIRRVCATVRQLADRRPDLYVVHATHPNPDVVRQVSAAIESHPRILVAPPIDYGDFALLLSKADVLLTDSGGIQEEAPSLGVPVLVARSESERVEGIDAGLARIVGTDPATIMNAVESALEDMAWDLRFTSNPYGDGHAATRIVGAMARYRPSAARAPRELLIGAR